MALPDRWSVARHRDGLERFVPAAEGAAMSTHTHAYVGYRSDGKAVMIFVDDGSKDCAKACAKVIRGGGRIERMTVEDARKAFTNRTAP
jgi:hypothetical protein